MSAIKQGTDIGSATITRIPANEYVYTDRGEKEHRVIYERHFGSIPANHHIHHINMVKNDNRIENLIAVPRNIHKWIHGFRTGQKYNFYSDICKGITKQDMEDILKIRKSKTQARNRPSFRQCYDILMADKEREGSASNGYSVDKKLDALMKMNESLVEENNRLKHSLNDEKNLLKESPLIKENKELQNRIKMLEMEIRKLCPQNFKALETTIKEMESENKKLLSRLDKIQQNQKKS